VVEETRDFLEDEPEDVHGVTVVGEASGANVAGAASIEKVFGGPCKDSCESILYYLVQDRDETSY